MKRLIIDCGQKHSLQLSGLFSGLVLLTRWFICGVCYSDAHIYRTDPIRSVLICAAVKLKLRELVCIIIIILHVCWKGLLVGLITPPVYDSKQQLKIRLYTDNTYCTFPLMLSWMHNVIESVRGSEQQAVDSDLSETRGRDKIELPAFSVVTSRGRLYWLFLVPSNRCRCRWARSQSDHLLDSICGTSFFLSILELVFFFVFVMIIKHFTAQNFCCFLWALWISLNK